jgi:uncharacterized membrane protein
MSRGAFRSYFVSTLLSGILVLAPIYLTLLLLLKAMDTLMGAVKPIAKALPLPHWLPTGELLSLLLMIAACFLAGVLIRTQIGRWAQAGIEQHVLRKLPGYTVIRGFTQQLLGDGKEKAWKPALAEIEEALVPAFIIEELEEGRRMTIFVPSAPTPFTGTVYVITADRVHPVNIPFAQAIRVISQWGGGSAALVAGLEKP